jgi:putative transposase
VAQKKALNVPAEERLKWIDSQHQAISVMKQCVLAGVPRSSYYYKPNNTESPENLEIMKHLDKMYMERPFYGSPKMTFCLRQQGYEVNHKRVERLMRLMGIKAIVPGPHTSKRRRENKVYPYLLRGMEILLPDKVWCADITYVPMRRGYMYLVAVMDWFSRYVLAWEISNSLDALFCMEALEKALARGTPGIFNTDQGAQFTSEEFTGRLERAEVRISMDGRGRAMDNLFVERLWRTVKYEDIYLRDYADGLELCRGLAKYFRFYNTERPHQSLGNRTPEQAYFGAARDFGRRRPLLPPRGREEEEEKKEEKKKKELEEPASVS